MQNLGAVIANLSRYRRQVASLALASAAPRPATRASHLCEMADFGANNGQLRAWLYRPAGLKIGAPLIVALHGCGQSAADCDAVAGWSSLADETGAMILFPEQSRENNRLLCFNWFEPRHVARTGGEAQSMREMVEAATSRHRLDRRRIFVVGLSAGGSMATALLALWPDVFAAGAVIAGLPFQGAANGLEAIAAMTEGARASVRLTRAVREASAYDGRWPRISIWQGQADQVVNPANGDRLLEQWLYVHGLAQVRPQIANFPFLRRQWRDPDGRVVVEQIAIEELGHGVPVAKAIEGRRFAVDIGLSSTREIARFWGLGQAAPRASNGASTRSAP